MPSSRDKQLRRERILQFIRENRDGTPPAGLQSPRQEETSLRQKKRVTFIHGKQQRSLGDLVKAKEKEKLMGQGLTSCLITKSSDTRVPAGGANIPAETRSEKKLSRRGSDCPYPCLNRRPSDNRIRGGENDPAARSVGRLPRTDSECRFHSPGLQFLKTQHPELASQEVKLNPSKPIRKELKNKCDFFPRYVDNRPFKDQTTQTLYRESSAQTLAYLPEIINKEKAETLELFSLAKILPGDKAPGMKEVEILERARKRWLFNEAMKMNFKRLLTEARNVAIKTELKDILEAFEWEHWVEREEAIQECQMMRLQIVIKMFDKREKEMHAASKIRIAQACERIEKRREAGLRKNEIEFQRGMRRINIRLAKTPRKWEKQSPMHALGSPCSEFYGPMLRHGVDPARRSFESQTGRRAFDMRIDDLEKRVNMKNVQCPFSKLKEWSKPKEYVREYEQNFCNDGNLQKLYESLKTLRTQADLVKESPTCLKKRIKLKERLESASSSEHLLNAHRKYSRYSTLIPERPREKYKVTDPNAPTKPRSVSKGHEDLEHLIHTYEGTYIGSIMQFLADEMLRLKEQRKLHFFCILAQRERWRREAGEAGLRQKENAMRMLYEEIFQHSNSGHQEVSQEYINTVMTKDIDQVMENEAAETVEEMAREIDRDIDRWLESLKSIQNPLNYTPLRLMLRDMICPDFNAMLQHHEKTLIAKYIVEDVILGRMWDELEPFDIVGTLTSDFIDRLIDNDLYLFSSDSESEYPQKTSWYEAQAIIRKLIRQATPGKRWQEETERIVTETYNNLFDDIFADVLYKIENPPPVVSSELLMVGPSTSMFNLAPTRPKNMTKQSMSGTESLQNSKFMGVHILSLIKKLKEDKVTRDLRTDETLHDTVPSDLFDTFIKSQLLYKKDIAFSNAKLKAPEVDLFSVTSTVDIPAQGEDLTAMHGSSHFKLLQLAQPGSSKSDTQTEDAADAEEATDVEPTDVEPGDVETAKVELAKVEPPAVEPSDVEPTSVEPTDGKAHKEIVIFDPTESESVKTVGDEPSLAGEGESDLESSKQVQLFSKHESTIFSFR